MAELAAAGLGCPAHESGLLDGHHRSQTADGESRSGNQRGGRALCKRANTGDFARGIMTTDIVPKTASCTD